MKKLIWTAADTAHGRELLEDAVRSYDRAKLEDFYAWLTANMMVDAALVSQTFDLIFRARDGARVLKLYDSMTQHYVPLVLIGWRVAKAVFFLVLAGAVLGGFVYFIRAITGASP